MKKLFFALFLCLSFAGFAQNQPEVKTEYHYQYAGKDSGLVVVRSIIDGKDTTSQATSAVNVKNLASEKAAQKAEVVRLLQQIEKELDSLFEIYFNVRKEEESAKKSKK